ncbi:MAG: protein kinase [Clostridia bacterium]|nr:protein kinase [Clostridia bacterium]
MDAYQNYIGLVLDDRYKIKRLVGEGGMAMVFEAEDLLKKIPVALKVLKDEFAADEVSVQRFINESKAVLMLSHPNIVKIFDVSVRGRYKYIVMEYLDGKTLKAYMKEKGALPAKEAIGYAIQILRALEHAHLGGIIHRDIKPQNIMLLKNGQIKVTDFGIAKLPDAKTLTATDKAIGTVFYISPEQAAGKKSIDRRADLYSVGVLMYEMCTGKLPFEGESPVAVALMQINDEPVPPRKIRPDIPEGLQQIILFAMEKDVDKRFQTATQMIDLLRKVRENPGVVFRQKKSAQKKTGNGGKIPMLPVIMGVVTAFLLVALVSGGVIINNIFFGEDVNNTVTATVGSYVGRVYDDALRAELDKTDFRIYIDYVPDKAETKDTVLSQKPAAGVTRKGIRGTKIADLHLYVSSGVSTDTMKDYTYVSRRQAELDLRNAGYTVRTQEAYSDTVPSGCIISTVPAAGAPIEAGSTILLTVSRGEEVTTVVVPTFTGSDTVSAYALLVENGLRLGSVSYQSSEEPAGVIIEQSPAAGSTVPVGVTKVNFVVSSGLPETTAAVTEPEEPVETTAAAPDMPEEPNKTEMPSEKSEDQNGGGSFDDWLHEKEGR